MKIYKEALPGVGVAPFWVIAVPAQYDKPLAVYADPGGAPTYNDLESALAAASASITVPGQSCCIVAKSDMASFPTPLPAPVPVLVYYVRGDA